MKTKVSRKHNGHARAGRANPIPIELIPQPARRAAAPDVLKIKKLLVPIDFSEPSHKALHYAVAFAKQFGATLSLVHVVDPVGMANGLPAFPISGPDEALCEDAKNKLFSLGDEEVDEFVPINVHVRSGQPAAEIAAAAKDLGTDLIIIATHGYTGLKHLVLGSTTEKVARLAPCPVLIVRETEHEFI
jgi:nucleotide-binding universal stress UspA family protein